MHEHMIFKGILTIDKQILKIENRYITISQIESLDIVKLDRYPLLSGVKLWFKGLIFLVILSLFYHGNSIFTLIGDLYCYSIFLLLIYNLFRHLKLFHALVITTSGDRTFICSQDEDFVYRIRDVLHNAMNSAHESKIINLDHCNINNGIVSYGNDNKNEVHL